MKNSAATIQQFLFILTNFLTKNNIVCFIFIWV